MGVRINLGKRGPTMRISTKIGGVRIGTTIPLGRHRTTRSRSAPVSSAPVITASDLAFWREQARHYAATGQTAKAYETALDVLRHAPHDSDMLRLAESNASGTYERVFAQTISRTGPTAQQKHETASWEQDGGKAVITFVLLACAILLVFFLWIFL